MKFKVKFKADKYRGGRSQIIYILKTSKLRKSVLTNEALSFIKLPKEKKYVSDFSWNVSFCSACGFGLSKGPEY